MTEQEWLTFSTLDSGHIWETECLSPLLTDRKFRLFATACCRRIWQYIPDEGSKSLVDSLEHLADGFLTKTEWEAACEAYERPKGTSQAEDYALSAVVTCRFDKKNRLADVAARYCLSTVEADAPPREKDERRAAEERAQADLIRELFGNPFRSVVVTPAWLTSTVTSLAEGIYADRAFDRMPILADALQDAGCDSTDILGHCRSDGPHVRGCWVIDLLLGKE